jgi:hypothetical protein
VALLPRRFVRQPLRPARYLRRPSSKQIGKARCHCRRGFAIIVRSIPPAVALIAPTIAGSSTSSTIAPNNRLAAAASALAIAIGGDFYVVIHDVIWSTMHNSTTINRFVDLGSTLCFGPQQHNPASPGHQGYMFSIVERSTPRSFHMLGFICSGGDV